MESDSVTTLKTPLSGSLTAKTTALQATQPKQPHLHLIGFTPRYVLTRTGSDLLVSIRGCLITNVKPEWMYFWANLFIIWWNHAVAWWLKIRNRGANRTSLQNQLAERTAECAWTCFQTCFQCPQYKIYAIFSLSCRYLEKNAYLCSLKRKTT